MNFEYSDVKKKFDDNAGQYDNQREKLIPCFSDFYKIAVSVAGTNKMKPEVLDIGAGTGLLSSFMLEKIPNANLTLIDISEKMIEIAKDRFKNNSALTYIVDDYSKYPFDKTYDIVVSSLSIHHLTDDQKQQLYAKIYSILNQGGVFVNADQVLGDTPFIETLYKRDWEYKVETSGLAKDEIQSAYERTALDKMATLKDQLGWLTEAGFSDVDCIYKYFNFVVLFGRKEE